MDGLVADTVDPREGLGSMSSSVFLRDRRTCDGANMSDLSWFARSPMLLKLTTPPTNKAIEEKTAMRTQVS